MEKVILRSLDAVMEALRDKALVYCEKPSAFKEGVTEVFPIEWRERGGRPIPAFVFTKPVFWGRVFPEDFGKESNKVFYALI